MKNLKYEMMETMMRYIKKKEDLGKAVTSKRQRNIIQRQCYQEFIDTVYKWITEMGDNEDEVDS